MSYPDGVGSAPGEVEVSVVMPCLNEEESIGYCIKEARDALDALGCSYEIVVCDNGSEDRSVEIASSLGARVVHQPEKGYGNAYHKGISEARGKYIVIGDSDGTYPFSEIRSFVERLRAGADMVMGTRLKGTVEPGAMPWLHRYVGNPLLTGLLNLLFRTGVSDAHCGMRAFTKEAYERLGLRTAGMEYASEMVIAAGRQGLKIEEVPIRYTPRVGGEPKLNTWSDGWRHLRFMLLEAPEWVLTLPGMILSGIGLSIVVPLANGPVRIGGVLFGIHTFVFGALALVLGVQVVFLGLTIETYARSRGFHKGGRLVRWFEERFTLERGILGGVLLILCGAVIAGYLVAQRIGGVEFQDLGNLQLSLTMMILVIIGFQVVFSSVFLAMLKVRSMESA